MKRKLTPGTMPTTEMQPVLLRGGLSVPLSALRVLWALEDRGFHVRLDSDDGGLVVSPRSRLSDDDDRAIRSHRDELIQLVRYGDGIVT